MNANRGDTSGPAARQGQFAHFVAEECLRNGETDAGDWLDQSHADFEDVGPFTADAVAAVNQYLDHVYSILRPEDHLFIEQRFHLAAVHPDMFGTSDCSIWKPDAATLHVLDYKHGVGVTVEADGNPQLKFYALGAMLAIDGCAPTRVVVTIVQPRCPHPDGPIRSAEFSALDLFDFAAELAAAAAAATAPNAPRTPGGHCKFCVGTGGHCPEFERKAKSAALDAFGAIADPETIPADDMADRLRLIPMLKTWIAAIEERANRDALAGAMPRGFKFIRGRGSRSWRQTDPATIAMVREMTGADISETVALSPAQAEKLIGKKTFADVAKLLVEQKPGRLQLAPMEHKAPAVAPGEINASSLSEFTTIED